MAPRIPSMDSQARGTDLNGDASWRRRSKYSTVYGDSSSFWSLPGWMTCRPSGETSLTTGTMPIVSSDAIPDLQVPPIDMS